MFEISDALQYISKTLDYIGCFGPIILLLSSLVLLKNKTTLLTFYIVGSILNVGLNVILKGIMQHPRPSEDLRLFNAFIAQGKRIGFDRYGMPSGHAQTVFYSVGFIFFALRDPLVTSLYILIALNTCYQRIKYKNHTILQVIFGGIIGFIVGCVFYFFSSKKIAGKLKSKKDDNAPI